MPLGINEKKNPAPGHRNTSTGDLMGVGNYGYSWSSAVNNTGGVFLDFGVTWIRPSAPYNRAYGFQLRCLSE
ncbi:hypothetical protein [uncultured Rikenella sp.]|uniref:hypothetical protein n=1 Tax=uncultured Rikenella sp. TaxID=368003 RepID=UPI0025F441BD|nr:hypothetical protein [uncultured Rikenella sp.]